MPEDTILHFADHHEETKPVLEKPSGVRTYREYLEHHYGLNRDADLPDLPDDCPDAKAVARINQGRWLWLCAACNVGILLDKDDKYSICVRCGSNGWMEVEWPENKAEIETELLKMTGTGLGKRLLATVREWRPGWTLAYLAERTKKALELAKKGGRVRALSIGARRIFTVGEILTADHMNTYVSDIEDDLAGANGPVEFEGAIVIDSLTTTERNAITLTGTGGLAASGNGLVIYNSPKNVFERYENGAWREFTDLASLTISGAAQGDVFIRGATAIQRLGAGTARQLFRTGGTGANPSWNDLLGTKIAGTTTQGSVFYEDSNGRLARLTPPTGSNQILQSQGANADPAWGGGAVVLTEFTTAGNYTFTPALGTRLSFAEVVAGGGGGGSGAIGNLTPQGGNGGGGGGRAVSAGVLFHHIEGTVSVAVGAGGAGGAGATAAGVGNAGVAGGQSFFGAVGKTWRVVSSGGAAGARGIATGTAANGAAGTAGGSTAAGGGGGGGDVNISGFSGRTYSGGAGGGASNPTATGGTGGAGNGALVTVDVNGNAGGAGSANITGAGGGGGGSSGSFNSQATGAPTVAAGGAGGLPGAGGGGGGGAGNIIIAPGSGAGGAGAAGVVRIWSW